MFDVLTERLGKYFRHEDPKHDVLQLGDRAIACQNIRRAISLLKIDVDEAPSDALLFDSTLEAGVKGLQHELRHRVEDGTVGPGTRRLIVWMLLLRLGPDIFARLKRTYPSPSVFLSYSHEDTRWVDELHNWLERQKDVPVHVHVIRDKEAFRAGATVSDNIRRAVADADKIIVIHSAKSHHRDWVALERAFAEEVERGLGSSLLIYLCLDDTPLPEHDKTRLAIQAEGKKLDDVGRQILRALEKLGP